MVEFCPNCDNLFNHNLDEDGKLIYHCTLCGVKKNIIKHCIIINEMDTKVQDYPVSINMMYDNTIPRTLKIPCPNPDCGYKGPSENPEIIVFQYNPTMLKSGYMCTHCKIWWKN
jgi:DNA-directed RNA polymerase subunit M/transcription elongation factor TFIIS